MKGASRISIAKQSVGWAARERTTLGLGGETIGFFTVLLT